MTMEANQTWKKHETQRKLSLLMRRPIAACIRAEETRGAPLYSN